MTTRYEAVRDEVEAATEALTLGEIERRSRVRYARPILEDLEKAGKVRRVRRARHVRWEWVR